jgi:uncharacterized protein (TIGR02145 family)
MKQKQRIALFGMLAVALILAACDGDSGNNSSEPEGNSSSSTGIYSSGGQMNSSPVVKSSSSSVGGSSSSVVASSSSAEVQSSSSVSGSSSSGALCTNTYGTNTVTDCRDGQTYKTVTIGTQTWMADNLNYADSAAMPNLKGNSWCYNNRADSCAKYGRLYTWTAAMNIASSYQSVSASAVIATLQQGACPAGWHIPTSAEWTTLVNYVGGSSTAGTKLKSTSGWYDSGNGTDAYGFSALPAGNRDYDGDFVYVGHYANFWSATEDATDYAYYRDLGYSYADMDTVNYGKDNAFSVRCVQD